MKTINLRWIYTHYRHDEFVEVSDEVWEAMRQAQREMNNYERRKVYHRAWYSLDAYSWTENYALEHGRSPEDILVEREEMTTRLRLIAALPAALAHATPTQARRVHAYYIAGIKQPEGGGQRTSCPPLPFSGGKPMKTINLRWIYPHYRHDEFVEVSDEVWEVMRQAQREMNNYERRKVYHRAYYSLDAYSWTENYALEHGRSPEDILLEREERAAHLRLLAALPEALAHATPTQARRVRAYYIAGISQPEISRREGVHSSKVSVAIRRGLRNMRRCYDCLFPAE